MRVLVAGARSALGLRATRLLRAAGHDVIGLSREARGPGFVTADVLDAEATLAAVREVAPDAIVQTLNALPRGGPAGPEDLVATATLRIDGTRNLLAAAHAAGVRRYVAENFFFVYGGTSPGSPPLTEDAPLRGTPETISEDEQARAFGGVVLRCALFYGDVGSTHARAERLRAGTATVPVADAAELSWVHIDDAATAVVAALERGSAGAAYNIAGSDVATETAMYQAVARVIGTPDAAAVPGGGRGLPHLVLATDRARAELGWTPRFETIDDGLRAMQW